MARFEGISIDHWLLAEAVRLREERAGRRGDDQAAVASARTVNGGLPARLAARARALPGAGDILADIRRLRRLARTLALALLAFAGIAGVLAARASVAERQVDILLAAAGLLAFPTVMLILWCVAIVIGSRRKSSGSLAGGILATGLRWLGPRVLGGDYASEVTLAGGRLLRTGFGRWLLSMLAHGLWVVYSLGALAALTVFFSIAQYDLIWGTTILTADTVVDLVRMLAWAPASLGLMAPAETEWILAGRDGALAGEVRAIWAHFLLAIIAVYGLLPRVVLTGASAGAALVGARRLSLDTRLPGYLRLAGVLAPAQPSPVEYGQPASPARNQSRYRHPKAAGNPVLIGIELECRQWPPTIPGIDADALGRADDRAGRQALLSALEALDRPPPALLVVCSMLRTPDAGSERFINRAADACRAVPVLIVDEGGLFEARGGRPGPRLADWQALAERTGGEAVRLDLDHPEAAGIAQLKRLVETGESGHE